MLPGGSALEGIGFALAGAADSTKDHWELRVDLVPENAALHLHYSAGSESVAGTAGLRQPGRALKVQRLEGATLLDLGPGPESSRTA